MAARLGLPLHENAQRQAFYFLAPHVPRENCAHHHCQRYAPDARAPPSGQRQRTVEMGNTVVRRIPRPYDVVRTVRKYPAASKGTMACKSWRIGRGGNVAYRGHFSAYTRRTIRCQECYPRVIQTLCTLDERNAVCIGATRGGGDGVG